MLMLRSFARHFYVPTMMVGFNALAIYLIANGYRYVWVGLLVLAAIGLSFTMERVLPCENAWNEDHGDAPKDLTYGVVYEVANLFTLLVFLIISAILLPEWSIWPGELPIAVQLLLAVVIVDCTMTIVHCFSHRVEWIRRLHAVHHGVHRPYGFNGFIRYPLHQALGAAIAIQLVVQHSNKRNNQLA